MQLLLVSPFITIIFSFLLVSGFTDKNDNPEASALVSANLFTVFVLLSFSLCSGLFIISPVADKEIKMRQMLNFLGMKSLAYFTGSFLADYVLFVIPTAGFIALLLGVMLTFGFSLISITYLFSFLFTNSNNAFK
jgi:hypothetical protein